MNLFKDKYKRRAVLGTFLIHLALVFLFYSFGLKYMDPKIEEGIAIEFGYVDEGMGTEMTQSEEIITEVVEQVQNSEESTPVEQTEIAEEVVTQEIVEAPVVTEDKEEEKSQELAPVEEEEKKPQASDELQQALSSLFQSTENTQSGDTENEGAQGDQSGSIEGAEEAVGGEGNSSDGYELGDRRAIRKPKPNYSCNETGSVVIRVWVNAEGETYKAELDLKNTTDTSPCLVREAKAAALKTSWLADANAEPIQIGSIIYNFRKL
jgi:outer membrane biosynthesis protein TonB